MNHPLVVATASFFAVALLARYASATHPVALVTAFPFAIFVYAQLRIQNQLGCPKKRGRRWAWFIYFFIFVYAILCFK